jgi:uncharacterized protein (DUF1697 family)
VQRRQQKNEVHIALLRGINVGGKNNLPMAALKEFFISAGCDDVRTYIQSGNVVFRASNKLANRIPAIVGQAITGSFGFEVPLVTRTATELHAVRSSNPFFPAEEPAKLHVVFLVNKPTKKQIRALDTDRSPPDQFVVQGREVFLLCPNGIARTKLTNAFWDSSLKTTSTIRNWNTVNKLIQLAEEL